MTWWSAVVSDANSLRRHVMNDLKCPVFYRENRFLQKLVAFAAVYFIIDSDATPWLTVPMSLGVYLYTVEGFVNTALLDQLTTKWE